MADGLPTTRLELRDWCLRKLGAPVLEMNFDEEQLEDRISEALAYFRDYHFDGVEKMVSRYKITATQLFFTTDITGTFQINETVIGLTSGAKAGYIDTVDSKTIRIQNIQGGEFLANEIVQGESSGATGTLKATNFITLGDIDNKYIPVDDSIIGIVDILPFNNQLQAGSIFNVQYQMALNSMWSLLSTDIIGYDMFKREMALLDFEFQGVKGLRFNRVTGKAYLDIDWINGNIKVDNYVVLITYKVVDPEAYSGVYGNYFVREYCYALFKEQWGTNLKKFSGVALPGGVTLNGQIVYDEGNSYRLELEKRISREWQLPVNFYFGIFMLCCFAPTLSNFLSMSS